MLMRVSFHCTDAALARMVIPRSRSRSLESIARSVTFWFSRKVPDCCSRRSTSVVLPWSTWAMMATLRRFIAVLLARTMAGARSHRKTGTHFSGSRSKTWNSTGRSHPKEHSQRKIRAQKGSPAERTGHTLLVAVQYSQKSPKNNALFAIWLVDFRYRNRLRSAAVGPVGGIDPAQHFLKVGFDRFIAQ